ncbi:MAG: tungstate ABC transporter substrate-binding protein WtpA [Candidatus Aminicenantales bacterium]
MFLFLLLTAGCGSGPSSRLTILHAGSLAVPFRQMARAFMERNPSIEVRTESAGSVACARMIIDFQHPADVLASADSSVIRTMLIPEYAEFCIDFSTNEMVLMFTAQSRHAGEIRADNWYQVLLRPDVEYGHSDPESDPCGYRTFLCWQLAEDFYGEPGLYLKLIQGCPPRNIRPKEVDLLALLEAGELDYIFIYRSVARQHGGLFLRLPEEINLSSPSLKEHYRKAGIQLKGKHPGEKLTRRGAPIVYGLTIPKTAKSPGLAARFIAFVLGPEGQRIMEENGQPEITPAVTDHFEALPDVLKPFVRRIQR